MAESRYYFVQDIMALMEIKERKAYDIIHSLNKELQSMGKLVISGRVAKTYFHYRYDISLEVITTKASNNSKSIHTAI